MDISLIALSVALVAAAIILAFALRRPAQPPEAPRDPRLDDVIRGQGNIAGQFLQTVEAQAQLQKMMAERIDALDKRLNETLNDNSVRTTATITSIGERLTVIDEAQKNISALSGQVVSLQQVLANKQSRGAFAQTQMEEIVRDGLPASLYEFQFTLSNRNRPDCIIRIPGSKMLLVVDAKFPLECFQLLRAAASDDDRKIAFQRVRTDVNKHIADIAERYLIPGEVQTPALMFVPSESIYADLHDEFADVIEKAHKSQVVVVSPNILMLAINTIQTVMKDARMREQTDLIRKEVGMLLNDVRLLSDRVTKLQTHFTQSNTDIQQILISTGKIAGRAEKIEKVEFAPEEERTLL
jgi:DNA recombination protein RmuC